MKNILVLGLLAFALCSCSKEKVDATPREVNLRLNYTFEGSGSMTRSGESIYSAFHDKYIKTHTLTPKTYKLVFENTETGATSHQQGIWGKKEGIKLLTGKYKVTGESTPYMEDGSICIDSLTIRFEENITITEDMTKLTLQAKHDSYMMFFDKANKKHIDYKYTNDGWNGEILNLKTIDDIYYCFISNTSNYSQHIMYIYDTNNTLKVSFNFQSSPFEKGKYYYFNDTTNSFDIPPMESGN